jgi:hypothetical protein
MSFRQNRFNDTPLKIGKVVAHDQLPRSHGKLESLFANSRYYDWVQTLADLYTFECRACGVWHIEEGDAMDDRLAELGAALGA